jgi:hypothetical protein
MAAFDDTFAALFAEMDAASDALNVATVALAQPDGLLNPHLNGVFDRLSRRATRQIGDNNLNGVA